MKDSGFIIPKYTFRQILTLSLLFAFGSICLLGQTPSEFNPYWEISDRKSIVLRLDSLTTLPYKDNIEMSGKNVASIIYYEVDQDFNVSIERDVIFPQLRTYNKSNEPDWKKYRAYFRRYVDQSMNPSLNYTEKTLVPSKVDSIEIGGMISFYYTPVEEIKLTKVIFPSMEKRLLVEEWQIENIGQSKKEINISELDFRQAEMGYKGDYTFLGKSDAAKVISLEAGESYNFPVFFGATLNLEKESEFDLFEAKTSRQEFLEMCQSQLVLDTPDIELNTLFYFSKIRAAESIYHSSMGLVHSPGGGNYYVGIWANDQVEYSGPFFPYLGYDISDIAAFNAYKKFLQNIPQDTAHIAYAFEVDGNFAMTHLDRGDAAMISYGTSLYALNTGDPEIAKELWPLVEWSLQYCHRKRNAQGAVQSASDEMEGRIETGSANLSTSTLYYGGLKYSIPIARALGKEDLAFLFEKRKKEMAQVIEDYFGATMEGMETYKYFDENQFLRHWICLPLTMGIEDRKSGTLDALFNTLWMEDGILVQYNPGSENDNQTFWDRATLYALRGALKMDTSGIGFEKLKQYTQKRLLGSHVPYAVEAYPENNMKHLSAESALYARIFIEGMLGIEPIGFSTIELNPNLPLSWEDLSLRNVQLFGSAYDLTVSRVESDYQVMLSKEMRVVFEQRIKQDQKIQIKLP